MQVIDRIRRHPLAFATGLALCLACLGFALSDFQAVVAALPAPSLRAGVDTAAQPAADVLTHPVRLTLTAVACTASGMLMLLVAASVLLRKRPAQTSHAPSRQQVRATHAQSQRPEQRKLIRRQRPLDPNDGGWQ